MTFLKTKYQTKKQTGNNKVSRALIELLELELK